MSLKCGLLWQNCVLANLGQLVLADIYNCNAIYTLQNLDRMYDNNLEPKLTLIQKASLMAFLRNFLDKMSTNWVLSFLKSFIAQSLWQETFKLPVEGQPALRITLSVSQSGKSVGCLDQVSLLLSLGLLGLLRCDVSGLSLPEMLFSLIFKKMTKKQIKND